MEKEVVVVYECAKYALVYDYEDDDVIYHVILYTVGQEPWLD
jgi:hypothetical protein